MYPFLYKYFVLYRKLVLPGIGKFDMYTLPAKLDFVEKTLHAPKYEIGFSNESGVPDKGLYHFLAGELGVDEWQAVNKFQDFVNEILKNAQAKGTVNLPGMGFLKTNSNNLLYFIPDNTISQMYEDVLLGANDALGNGKLTSNLVQLYKTGESQIVTAELESDQLEKIVKSEDDDYWWVYALILAMMGAGALLYYYI